MTTEESLFISIGSALAESSHGQLFGKPCFKYNGKAFVCFFQNEMVFKLSGAAHNKAMAMSGAKLFDPSGKKRPMKDWVQIPSIHQQEWSYFAQEALKNIRQA